MNRSLTFLGAAGCVTGSKHLLDVDGTRILVDCGLFQGLKELRERNWQPLPVEPSSIHAVVLTHAHLDHCGYLPRLVAGGYEGRIFCTPGTADLCRIVLPDAAKLQEEDAERANRRGYSRHMPALPLFTSEDAERALSMLQPVGYDRPVPPAPGLEVEFINAGHLLGSAFARIRTDGLHILFGGDLGRYDRPVLPDPTPVAEADVLLVESTYGDRQHGPNDDGEELARVIRETIDRGGRVIVPAFAIGRVEEVLYWIKTLEDRKRIPVVPVWVDSPMASEALVQYGKRLNELDADLRPGQNDAVPTGPHARGTPPARREAVARYRRDVAAFATDRLHIVASPQQSRELTSSRGPAIVISASGMATGGRVLHHLAAALPDEKSTVLFVGFQAEGTRGRQLVDGAAEVKIHGTQVPVRARIAKIDSMSAHADAGEILRWLRGFERAPNRTYLVHGEPEAATALRGRIAAELKWPVEIARHLQRVPLGDN
jgi:metallo-beta-lactamase family protein